MTLSKKKSAMYRFAEIKSCGAIYLDLLGISGQNVQNSDGSQRVKLVRNIWSWIPYYR